MTNSQVRQTQQLQLACLIPQRNSYPIMAKVSNQLIINLKEDIIPCYDDIIPYYDDGDALYKDLHNLSQVDKQGS